MEIQLVISIFFYFLSLLSGFAVPQLFRLQQVRGHANGECAGGNDIIFFLHKK